jgi:hypothetical protein
VISLTQTEGSLRISLKAEAGRTYHLQRRDEINGLWARVGDAQAATVDGPINFLLSLPQTVAASGLYRVEVQ